MGYNQLSQNITLEMFLLALRHLYYLIRVVCSPAKNSGLQASIIKRVHVMFTFL